MKVSNDLKKYNNGYSLLFTNYRLKLTDGLYSNILFQCYTHYRPNPNDTVYQLQIHTNVNKFKELITNTHYYIGEDLSQFRLPDNELLKIGSPYSKREFEILKIIANGYSAGQIAQELFLSVNTVNTHRGNILNKSGHKRIQELVAEMKEKGVI